MKIIVSFRALNFITLNLLLVLLICSSLSLAARKHRNLFPSTYEFIAVVKPSRWAVFFIFNVIMIAIFFRSFKPFKDCDHFLIPVSTLEKVGVTTYTYGHGDYDNYSNGDYSDDEDDEYHGSDGYDEDYDDDSDDYDEDDDSLFSSEEDNYEDKKSDLLMRIEDFIAKNNNMWREELRRERLLFIEASTEILTSSSS